MAEHKPEHRDGAGPLEPPAPGDQFAAAIPPAQRHKPPAWIWFGLGGLFLLALAVVFVLPSVVSEYELPLERRVSSPEVSAPVSTRETQSTISPFEEAQRARQRSEAQEVLAQLLEIQNELEALDVEAWADGDYRAALDLASIGDEYYRSQDFVLASSNYEEARDSLASIRSSVPRVFEDLLASGSEALSAGDAELAEDRFSLARLLDPESEQAEIGLQRARSLEEVAALFEEAEELAGDGELSAAREVYTRIVDLDSYNERARAGIEAMSVQIREREFSRVMSEGYAHLQNGDPEAAIEAFQRAASMGVNESQAEAAIVQTETEVANAQIAERRERIAAAEADEDWQQAVSLYEEVLEIDPNLLFAREGRDYAGKRAQLDQLLVNGINNPERLADDAVFQETLDVYYTGRALDRQGPKLQGQLDELEGLLEASQIPVEVELISDNLTTVTLLREGELGNFERRTLTLQPGRYVAIGRRPGYREVRQEFVAGFGQTPDQVVVRSEERVPGGSR